MKICIQERDKERRISLPDWLVLNKFLLSGSLQLGSKGLKLAGMNRERAAILLDELKRVKREKGEWALVEVQTAKGEHIKIIL